MPEVPSALPAPKSLGGLLNHIDEREELKKQDSLHLSERAEEISEISKRDNNRVGCLLKMMKSKKNQRLNRRFEYAASCP